MRHVSYSTSAKIITALDAGITLAIEQVGYTLRLPAYDPIIIGTVIGTTYVLLKHKDRISSAVLDASDHVIDASRQVTGKFKDDYPENAIRYR